VIVAASCQGPAPLVILIDFRPRPVAFRLGCSEKLPGREGGTLAKVDAVSDCCFVLRIADRCAGAEEDA